MRINRFRAVAATLAVYWPDGAVETVPPSRSGRHPDLSGHVMQDMKRQQDMTIGKILAQLESQPYLGR